MILFISGLFISAFALQTRYAYDEACSTCQGSGTANCEACYGSGKCWICNGTGEIWYMPETDNWCAACRGTGICYACNGLGSYTCKVCGGTGILVHWMFTLTGSAIVLPIVNILLFLGLFVLGYVASAFYLSFNEWVYEVDDMGLWFNPSFMTWLFAKHPRRWAKWQTAINLILSVYFGTVLFWIASLKQITGEAFAGGVVFGIMTVGLFSLLFYKSYTSRLRA